MKKYRTQEQWEEMTENMINGNWSEAGKNCAEYAFYAGDIRKKQDNDRNEGTNTIIDDLDFCELIEIAQKYR